MARIGIWALGVASAAGIVAMLVVAWQKIQSGHGADGFRNVWLMEDNWFGVLAFLAVLVIAIAIGLLLRWRARREWKELEEKCGAGRPGDSSKNSKRHQAPATGQGEAPKAERSTRAK